MSITWHTWSKAMAVSKFLIYIANLLSRKVIPMYTPTPSDV